MVNPVRITGIAAVLLLALVMAPSPSAGTSAGPNPSQPAGLMWNRTGLPAVFPLQVKTPPGQDYFLTLIDNDTGTPALAAYITGGAFFRVLVPPGTFRVTFATGDVWQGEEDLFGAATHVFELGKALTFETRGLGTKAGHVVNLLRHQPGQRAGITRKDQLICQSFAPDFPAPALFASQDARDPRHAAAEDRDARDGRDVFKGPHRFSTMPRRDVRSRYCG